MAFSRGQTQVLYQFLPGAVFEHDQYGFCLISVRRKKGVFPLCHQTGSWWHAIYFWASGVLRHARRVWRGLPGLAGEISHAQDAGPLTFCRPGRLLTGLTLLAFGPGGLAILHVLGEQ